MESQWRNRVVALEHVDPEQLLANPLNWRVHPKHQQDALEGSLNEIGWMDAVIVQQGTDVVIDGHLRVSLALRHSEQTVPVMYVDLDDAEARLALATFDHITSMAVADTEVLDDLLREVSTSEPALQEAIAGLAESSGLYPDGDAGDADEPEDGSLLELADVTIRDPDHEVQRGDVWHVGRHLLICADVIAEWHVWSAYLTANDDLFIPYPGPYVPLTEEAAQQRFIMVQPDPYIAGHLLDRYVEIHGKEAVSRD